MKTISRMVIALIAFCAVIAYATAASADVRVGRDFVFVSGPNPDHRYVRIGNVNVDTPAFAEMFTTTPETLRADNPQGTLALCKRHNGGYVLGMKIRSRAARRTNAVWADCNAPDTKYVYLVPGETIEITGRRALSFDEEIAVLGTLKSCTTSACVQSALAKLGSPAADATPAETPAPSREPAATSEIANLVEANARLSGKYALLLIEAAFLRGMRDKADEDNTTLKYVIGGLLLALLLASCGALLHRRYRANEDIRAIPPEKTAGPDKETHRRIPRPIPKAPEESVYDENPHTALAQLAPEPKQKFIPKRPPPAKAGPPPVPKESPNPHVATVEIGFGEIADDVGQLLLREIEEQDNKLQRYKLDNARLETRTAALVRELDETKRVLGRERREHAEREKQLKPILENLPRFEDNDKLIRALRGLYDAYISARHAFDEDNETLNLLGESAGDLSEDDAYEAKMLESGALLKRERLLSAYTELRNILRACLGATVEEEMVGILCPEPRLEGNNAKLTISSERPDRLTIEDEEAISEADIEGVVQGFRELAPEGERSHRLLPSVELRNPIHASFDHLKLLTSRFTTEDPLTLDDEALAHLDAVFQTPTRMLAGQYPTDESGDNLRSRFEGATLFQVLCEYRQRQGRTFTTLRPGISA